MKRHNQKEAPVFSSEEEQAAFYRDVAFSYLDTSMRTSYEVRSRLREAGCPETLIPEIISMLEDYRYIDDEAYAAAYVRQERKLRHRSRRDMTDRLTAKGVDRRWIEAAYAMEGEDAETTAAISLIEKKTRKSKPDVQKLAAFLARRGFSYDTIRQAMAACGEASMNESPDDF